MIEGLGTFVDNTDNRIVDREILSETEMSRKNSLFSKSKKFFKVFF